MSITAAVAHIKADLAGLRRAYPADDDFAAALRAVSRRLRSLRIGDGIDLDSELTGWSRVKFSSTIVANAVRIIFRPDTDGIELRAFGHRHDPESVYLRAAERR
jgi:hypothetical protein